MGPPALHAKIVTERRLDRGPLRASREWPVAPSQHFSAARQPTQPLKWEGRGRAEWRYFIWLQKRRWGQGRGGANSGGGGSLNEEDEDHHTHRAALQKREEVAQAGARQRAQQAVYPPSVFCGGTHSPLGDEPVCRETAKGRAQRVCVPGPDAQGQEGRGEQGGGWWHVAAAGK